MIEDSFPPYPFPCTCEQENEGRKVWLRLVQEKEQEREQNTEQNEERKNHIVRHVHLNSWGYKSRKSAHRAPSSCDSLREACYNRLGAPLSHSPKASSRVWIGFFSDQRQYLKNKRERSTYDCWIVCLWANLYRLKGLPWLRVGT